MSAHWLEVREGTAPLIVSLPHTGVDLPPDIEARLVGRWLARKDADWWIQHLYDFAGDLGATVVRTGLSRTVIDVNRDPSGATLYPGQATTGLCPLTTFDGEALYRAGEEPGPAEIERRRGRYFDPYHDALAQQIYRLRGIHGQVVLYDAHSIRSRIARLFEGELPHFNIGTNGGASCDPALTGAVARACAGGGRSQVINGRFKGGWTTRYYGQPAQGVHAIQMELACRGYMDEPEALSADNWPPAYDRARAAPLGDVLVQVLTACLAFIRTPSRRTPPP